MADPLSAVLRSVRLSGGVFVDARFTAPWCVRTRLTAADWSGFLAKPTQVIAYHVVIAGELVLSIGNEPPVRVRAGEIALLTRNDDHVMASGPGLEPAEADALIQHAPEGGLARIVHGGGGAAVHMICGFLGSEDEHAVLLASLPRLLTLDIRAAASRDWIEASVRFAAQELTEGRLATSNVMTRLSEVLLVEAVRHYTAQRPAAETGWLNGLADPQIGRALALMHGDLRAPWTAERLARAVAMSRSAFMDRFRARIGVPPIRYLTALRLQAARLHLRESDRPVGQLAHLVGYESEEAFSRAFKREYGVSPAHWRERLAA
ncbi:cupin domain-containing protein [Elioraea sp.]|uniref:AraC family transcriptional regulator n=1 Tax=Elioraea sp. TaxID=2185103 RepID=UPI003F6EF2D7